MPALNGIKVGIFTDENPRYKAKNTKLTIKIRNKNQQQPPRNILKNW